MKLDKWSTWRIINSVVIFLSFFAPFVVMDWGGQRDLSQAIIYNGFDLLDWYRILGMAYWKDTVYPDTAASLLKGLLTSYVSGLVTIFIYCAINLLLAIFKPKLIDKPMWIILAFCLIALGIRSLWYIIGLNSGWGTLSNALLGYWLVLLGLVSSILLDTSYFLSRRI